MTLESSPAEPPTEPPPSPVTAKVLEELERLERRQGNLSQGLLLLGASALLFVGVGLTLSQSLSFVVCLVLVLLIHESGHWVAMRAFGYRDMRMFFLPFFGAAVSGRKSDASGAQRAIVSLAGPLPGIVLAFPTMFFGGLLVPWEQATLLGALMLVVNAFNLLPLEPLDGGRFMNVVLYIRHPGIETGMRILAVAAFAAGALWLQDWLLGLLGVLASLSIGRSRRLALAARELSPTLAPAERSAASIPAHRREEVATLAASRVIPELDAHDRPRELAVAMRDLWDRSMLHPPSLRTSVALVGAYLAILAMVVGAGLWVVSGAAPEH